MADYGANEASVRVSGIVLPVAYAAFQAGGANEVQQDFANIMGVPSTRIASMTGYGVVGDTATAVSFTITPPGAAFSKTAMMAAQVLSQQLSQSTGSKVLS